MRRIDLNAGAIWRLALAGACLIGCLGSPVAARAGGVTIPGSADFPESMTGTPDGTLYFSSFAGGDGLYRVAMNPDASAGAITKLKTSRPLFHSDGLRTYGGKLLMVEGETKGFLDLITLSGDDTQIDAVKSGFEGPVSLWQVGDTIYVLDVPLKYMFVPNLRGKGPPAKAFAIKAP
jgi:hypothetical protein